MKHKSRQLIPGLHIAIVSNFAGGSGGSMLALEVYATCLASGIGAIIATNDRSHDYSNMGYDLQYLPVICAGDTGQDQVRHLSYIKQLVAKARSLKKLLIVDFKAGYASAHQMLNALRDAGAFQSSSVAALVPAITGDYGVRGSAVALRTMESMKISVDRGLIRMWTLPRDPKLPDIAALPPFPVWSVDQLTHHEKKMIHRGYWNSRRAAIYLIFQCPAQDRSSIPKVLAHFDAAKSAIYDAIIAPITKPIQESLP